MKKSKKEIAAALLIVDEVVLEKRELVEAFARIRRDASHTIGRAAESVQFQEAELFASSMLRTAEGLRAVVESGRGF